MIRKFFTPTFLAIITFFGTCLLVSTIMWVYNSFTFSGGLSIQSRLETFANKYSDDLKKDVFDTLFAQAKQCVAIQNKNKQETCRKAVGIKLADVLHEEELADSKKANWPNDLFFIKREKDTFYQVGWDGELKDISSVVNKKVLSDKQSYISLLLQHNCNYFQISSNTDSCEVYATIQLDTTSKGYLVRMMPFQEETNFFFALLMPYFGLNAVSDFQYGFRTGEITFIGLSFLNILIPLIVSIIAVYLYKKKKS